MGTAAEVAVAGAKAGLAVLLLVAGAAKLAGLDGFAATVRLFVPARLRRPQLRPLPRVIALAVALGEVALGGLSLAAPAAAWVNPVVLAAGGGFVIVSVVGYARHRGRSCRCFGALSRRRFDRAGIGRAVLIVAAAGLPLAGRLPASAVRLTPADRGLLLAAALLLGAGAFTAARVLAASPDPVPWGSPRRDSVGPSPSLPVRPDPEPGMVP
jgi:hypothetical protein